MRERELQGAAICALCRKPFGASGLPLFYRVRIQHFGLNVQALRRQSGLEAFLGNVALAQVMGADEEMAKVVSSVEFTVCESCSCDTDRGSLPVAALAELANEQQEAVSEPRA